jgi:hypothetical protein
MASTVRIIIMRQRAASTSDGLTRGDGCDSRALRASPTMYMSVAKDSTNRLSGLSAESPARPDRSMETPSRRSGRGVGPSRAGREFPDWCAVPRRNGTPLVLKQLVWAAPT